MRTILDLAASRAPEWRLAAAIDSAIRLRLSAPLVIERRLSELRGPGRCYFVSEYTWGDVSRRPGYVVRSLTGQPTLRSARLRAGSRAAQR